MINPQTQTRQNLTDAGGKVARDVQELGSLAADSVADTVGKLKEQGRELLSQGKESAKKAEAQLERFIGDHPIKSILIAVGVGALLGFTFRR